MNKEKVYKYLSYASLVAVIILMAAATVVERLYGTEVALARIYHHPVFFLLWAMAAVAGLLYLLHQGAGRRPFTLGIHIALVIILAGALVTHLSGVSGSIHLRVDEPSAAFVDDYDSEQPLPFSLELKEFRIEYDPGTTHIADYVSELVCEDQPVTISMNHIFKKGGYRFYQADYDEDGQGSILAVSRDPWGVGITYAGYLLLLVCMVGFFFEPNSAWRETLRSLRHRKEPGRKRKGWTLVLVALGAAMLIVWLVSVFPKGPLMPVLRSSLLFIHVIPIIISYALFGLAALLGIAGLLVRPDRSQRLQGVSRTILLPAVFLLTFGTFLGGVWANISWGNYWAWDPKETWALITMLVYSFALHGDALRAFRKPRFFHAFCVLAFLAVLVTYFGVNLLLGGMHSYA